MTITLTPREIEFDGTYPANTPEAKRPLANFVGLEEVAKMNGIGYELHLQMTENGDDVMYVLRLLPYGPLDRIKISYKVYPAEDYLRAVGDMFAMIANDGEHEHDPKPYTGN